jgi:hypothetical protein
MFTTTCGMLPVSLSALSLRPSCLAACIYVYISICYGSPHKLSMTRLRKSHGNQIHASTMSLVTDLANFLSKAEVKTVTRYQKPMKWHAHAPNVINKIKQLHIKHMDPCQHTPIHKSFHMSPTHNIHRRNYVCLRCNWASLLTNEYTTTGNN